MRTTLYRRIPSSNHNKNDNIQHKIEQQHQELKQLQTKLKELPHQKDNEGNKQSTWQSLKSLWRYAKDAYSVYRRTNEIQKQLPLLWAKTVNQEIEDQEKQFQQEGREQDKFMDEILNEMKTLDPSNPDKKKLDELSTKQQQFLKQFLNIDIKNNDIETTLKEAAKNKEKLTDEEKKSQDVGKVLHEQMIMFQKMYDEGKMENIDLQEMEKVLSENLEDVHKKLDPNEVVTKKK